jgi:hypothetical protein
MSDAPPAAPAARRLLPTAAARGAAVAFVAACFLAVAAAPLAVYALAIAVFGLAHVGAELRFVDRSFAGLLPKPFVLGVAACVAVAAAARLCGQTGALTPTGAVTLELAAGAAMALVAAAAMRRRRAVAVLTLAGLVAGTVVAPWETFLAFAIAHNLTPLAFVADAAPPRDRALWVGLLLIPFVILPLLIATGWPGDLLARTGLFAPEAAPLAVGPLDANLPAWVPMSLLDSDHAIPLFSACVFAQTMHYAAVIHLLPRLVGEAPRATLAPWPPRRLFLLGLATAAAALALVFAMDYALARRIYALAALVHAWIEIPILLLALDRRAPDET